MQITNQKSVPGIVELNIDVEPFITQGTATRPVAFNDPFKPLQFIHFSDIHAIPALWNRIVEYLNYYSNYIFSDYIRVTFVAVHRHNMLIYITQVFYLKSPF